MSDDEGGAHDDPEYNPADALEQQEPSGERVVTTMGKTYTLKIEEHHKTMEEDEDALVTVRAKMYRFENSDNEWKERGTGDVRVMKHKVNGKCRVLMRRDKTLKICANHLITHDMALRPHIGSDKAFVYHVVADYADGEAKADMLAIRFGSAENATKFKEAFEQGKVFNEQASAAARAATSSPTKEKPEEKKDA